ncbi:polyprenol monophosphomannose synthase [Candidatus Undinarchaeota archaeon]
MKPCIVLPTYNEKDNITKIVPAILDIFKKEKIKGIILVVDDNSPDGTGKLANSLSKKHKNVKVLHRKKKEGLGRAYIAGFKKAISFGADVILEMDADFSHNPKYLPELLKGIRENDLMLGSRYIPGGETPDWPPSRKLISWGANTLAKVLTGIRVHDVTGGYRAYKKEVLEMINLDSIKTNGYAFQIEMLYRTQKAGFRIGETPIVFYDRKYGSSKLSKSDIKEFFLIAFKLRLSK